MTELPLPLTQCQTITSEAFERLNRGAWLMEPKIDGWRMQMDVTSERVRAWTRTQHDASRKMPMAEHQLKKLTSGKHTFRLDGEAVFINEDGTPDYNFTARCLGSGTETCVAKQAERGHLTYFVFDLLMLDGDDLRAVPLEQRKEYMRNFLAFTGNVDIVFGEEPSYERHAKNVETFKEGSVLKLVDSTYAGKRHKSWLKWKEMETIDVKIVGYKPGQGKYKDLIGAINFMAPDGTEGYCSGMDDETRVWISDHRAALVGTWIEIHHFGKLVDGYRHPQFLRLRPDKQ